jgi:hypothetical protein
LSVRASIRELLAAGSDLHARGDLADPFESEWRGTFADCA